MQSKTTLHIRRVNVVQVYAVLSSIQPLSLYFICFPKCLSISIFNQPRVLLLLCFTEQNESKGSPSGMPLCKLKLVFTFHMLSTGTLHDCHIEVFVTEHWSNLLNTLQRGCFWLCAALNGNWGIRLLCSFLFHGYQYLCHFKLDCFSAWLCQGYSCFYMPRCLEHHCLHFTSMCNQCFVLMYQKWFSTF